MISEKARFRTTARALRRDFLAGLQRSERRALEAALADRAAPLFGGAATVASYAPMGGEIDPAPLVAKLGPDVRIALPWFENRESPMRFRAAGASLEPGPFGTMQPKADAALCAPDALIVPLVAADLAGNRVGQGKGHFDRTLGGLRAAGLKLAIGLAWDVQIFDSLPVDTWDQRLDAVVTPTRVIAV